MLADSHSTNWVLTFFRVVEGSGIIETTKVRFFLNKPAYFPTDFSVPSLGGWFKHSEPGSLTFVLPHIDIVFRTNNNVSFGHAIHNHIHGNFFGLNDGSDRIAEVNLGNFIIVLGEDGAELSLALNLGQILHIFHELLIGFGVPKHHTKLHSV